MVEQIQGYTSPQVVHKIIIRGGVGTTFRYPDGNFSTLAVKYSNFFERTWMQVGVIVWQMGQWFEGAFLPKHEKEMLLIWRAATNEKDKGLANAKFSEYYKLKARNCAIQLNHSELTIADKERIIKQTNFYEDLEKIYRKRYETLTSIGAV